MRNSRARIDARDGEQGMPLKTADQLKERATALRKKLADTGGKMDGPKVRALKKRIRRTQRKRRKIVANATRRAAAATKKSE
jgi:hypothetical protein